MTDTLLPKNDEDELLDKCHSIQLFVGFDDQEWESFYGNKGGLYGLIKARDTKMLEHVLGQPIDPIDVGALTGPKETASTMSLTQAQGAYLSAHNGLLNQQRKRAKQWLGGSK